jgi:hypothetical protein
VSKHILEPAAQRFADSTSKPPFLCELGAERARKVLDDTQAAPIAKPDVDERWTAVPAALSDVRGRNRKGRARQLATRDEAVTDVVEHGRFPAPGVPDSARGQHAVRGTRETTHSLAR